MILGLLLALLPFLAFLGSAHAEETHFLYQQALQERSAGRLEEAVHSLDEFLRAQPASDWGWQTLVDLHIEMGREAELEARLQRLLASAETPGPAHYALGYLQLLQGKNEEAQDALERSINAGYRTLLSLNARGTVERRLGNFAESLDWIEEAVPLDPEEPLTRSNLFESRAWDVGVRVLDALRDDINNAEIAELKKEALEAHSEGTDPLTSVEVFSLHDALGGRSVTLLALQNDHKGRLIFFAEPELPIGFAGELSFEPMPDADWELIDKFKSQIVFVRQSRVSGSHHEKVVLLYVTAEGKTGELSHEWQTESALILEDLDKDGLPEALLDASDHYVDGFAAGIVDFNVYVYRLDPQTAEYVFVPYRLESPFLVGKPAELNAQALFAVGRGQWRVARDAIRKARAVNPTDEVLQWNALVIEVHAEAFESQYRAAPSFITAALLGDPSLAIQQDGWEPSLTPQPLMRVLQAMLESGVQPEHVQALRSQLYGQGRVGSGSVEHVEELLAAFENQTPPVTLQPELRALESAITSYLTDRLTYVPPEVTASTMLRLLEGPGLPELRQILSQDKAPETGYSIDYAPSSLMEMFSESIAEGKTWEEEDSMLRKNVTFFRLFSLLRRKDFRGVQKLVEVVRSTWPDDQDMAVVVTYVQQILDLRYGRYHSVLRSLRSSDSNRYDLNALEAFERLGMPSVASQAYREAIDRFESEGAKPDPFVALEGYLGHLGLGRIALRAGRLNEAREHFLTAMDLVSGSFLGPPYSQVMYGELLTLLSRAHLGLGHLELARAYNALAYHASLRMMEQGEGWIQSAFQYDYERLPSIFFTDFLIARARGENRLSSAYLSAAVAVVKDIYLLTPGTRDRLGVNEVAHEIFRAAVRFHLELGRREEAFVLLDSVKQTTALQDLLRVHPVESGATLARSWELSLAELGSLSRPEDVTILQYFVSEDSVTVFSFGKDSMLNVAESRLPIGELRRWVDEALDSSIGLGASSAEGRARRAHALRVLYDHLIAPLGSNLPPEDRLLIIPDRVLFQLPFSFLLAPSGRYLVQDHPISYAGSLASLAAIAKPKADLPESILVVHTPLSETLEPLEHSGKEAEVIFGQFPDVQRKELSREVATMPAFLEQARRRTLIHVATHSLIDTDEPEASAIVLGELTADHREVVTLSHLLEGKLELEAAPLVVLSSCSSAQGRIYEEGLVGLAQGLFLSGASTVILTQWEIADEATPRLMQHFYAAYRESRDVALALQRAQVQLIHDGVEPEVWAPFVVFGHGQRKAR